MTGQELVEHIDIDEFLEQVQDAISNGEGEIRAHYFKKVLEWVGEQVYRQYDLILDDDPEVELTQDPDGHIAGRSPLPSTPRTESNG